MFSFKDYIEYVNGREIVVYGTGDVAPSVVRDININGGEVGLFISLDWKDKPDFMGKKVYGKEILDKDKHYVVVGTSGFAVEVSRDLRAMGFNMTEDYFCAYEVYSELDRYCNGVPVGRGSYLPESWEHSGKSGVLNSRVGSIGRFTSINPSVQISGNHNMGILSTGQFRSFLDRDIRLELNKKYKHLFGKANRVKIGNDVWIGANVFINASKVKEIGDGAIIGSGAVIIEDVPPYAVVVGVPAKVKKYRYTPEQIECLLRVKWWDWSDSELNENAELLYNPDMFFERFMRKN